MVASLRKKIRFSIGEGYFLCRLCIQTGCEARPMSTGLKWPEYEADHLPSCNAEVNK